VKVDYDRVCLVFLGALDLQPLAIPPYLDEQCGDDAELRKEVESLLGFHDTSELIDESTQPLHLHTPLQPDGPAPTQAPLIGGRYRELDLLGVGGCGRVVRAWDDVLKRFVAHKRVRTDHAPLARMLQHEARLLAWLDHTGAVPVYDAGFDEGGAFYTMRVFGGETLRERLDREGRLPIRQTIRILSRMSETMANAHAKGVLHLDLKPANIMLLPYGQVCILDWGVARFHDLTMYQAYRRAAGDLEVAQESGYSGIAGTPAYMPVEQVSGEGLSRTADIFACGTILYEMLCGKLPHAGGSSPLAVLRKAISEVTPPRAHRADIPEALEGLCLQMIAAEPSHRPSSFEQVIAALDRLNHGAERVEERSLAAGQVLFREGESGTEAFQILAGSLSITIDGTDGATELARRGVGDLVGEMAAVSGATRSATVTALEPTRVAIVTSEVIETALETANPMVARMLRSLVDRLREEADRARRG